MRTFSKRTTIVAASVAAALGVAGVAYAYYNASVSGTGTGTAAAANSTIADVTPANAVGAITGLVPGGTAQTTTVNLTNSNPFSVHVAAGSVAVSLTNTTGLSAACDTLAEAGISGSGSYPATTIASGGTLPVTVSVSMDDLSTDQTACNGKTFNLTYTAS